MHVVHMCDKDLRCWLRGEYTYTRCSIHSESEPMGERLNVGGRLFRCYRGVEVGWLVGLLVSFNRR